MGMWERHLAANRIEAGRLSHLKLVLQHPCYKKSGLTAFFRGQPAFLIRS
jgi:hypothetical protein